MQSIGIDIKTLFRYHQEGTVTPNRGGAVANWVRSGRRYRLSFYPLEASRGREEFGYSNEVHWRIVVNDSTDFKLGDCIGDAERRLYEIVRIRTFRNQQQIEAREIWRTP